MASQWAINYASFLVEKNKNVNEENEVLNLFRRFDQTFGLQLPLASSYFLDNLADNRQFTWYESIPSCIFLRCPLKMREAGQVQILKPYNLNQPCGHRWENNLSILYNFLLAYYCYYIFHSQV